MELPNKNARCNICFTNSKNIVTLYHLNSIGDVSDHQMCYNCYKLMRSNKCPFCRNEIDIERIKCDIQNIHHKKEMEIKIIKLRKELKKLN
jgi:hypothetical protein